LIVPAQVEVTLPASVDVMAELRTEIARDLGVSVKLGYDSHRSLGDLPAYVIVAAALQPFFNSMLTQWGSDAATRLTRALNRLRHVQRSGGESNDVTIVKVVEPTYRITMIFDDAAARDPQAVRRMLDLQFETMRPRTVLRWSPERGDWRAERRSRP
jgi:hypothetical protein